MHQLQYLPSAPAPHIPGAYTRILLKPPAPTPGETLAAVIPKIRAQLSPRDLPDVSAVERTPSRARLTKSLTPSRLPPSASPTCRAHIVPPSPHLAPSPVSTLGPVVPPQKRLDCSPHPEKTQGTDFATITREPGRLGAQPKAHARPPLLHRLRHAPPPPPSSAFSASASDAAARTHPAPSRPPITLNATPPPWPATQPPAARPSAGRRDLLPVEASAVGAPRAACAAR
ncbi:hypothetical protein C8J57DRAFT_1642852 [Mycena rebaudengoi]|nr:hypothetical protein C8J57DRAFT_1642852 [Mycena rebaudengoi]